MTGGQQSAAIDGGIPDPPPGWARWSDHLRAKVFARSIDDKLLSGDAANGSPVFIVRRARLLDRRYRAKVARALRKLIETAGRHEPNFFAAQLPLRVREVLGSASEIRTLADELEHEDRVSPRGVILAERLITDGESPVYPSMPHQRGVETVESAVRHARAALHLG
jgi:hypothetical protein